MDPHSQHEYSQCATCILEDQIRYAYGRLTYSHKTQEKCADTLISWSTWTTGIKIVLSAASSIGIGSTFFDTNALDTLAGFDTSFVGAVAGGLAATILFALNLWAKEKDLDAMAQRHRDSASQMWLIREKYLSLIADLNIGNKALTAIQAQRDSLSDELHKVYKAAPSSNSRAYRQAQKALKYDEEMTLDDSEIDSMLPKSFRKRWTSGQRRGCRHSEVLTQCDRETITQDPP